MAADINLMLNALETDPFGNRFLDQTDTDGIITASFEGTGTDLTLSFMGYDVDDDREIRVFVNGVERDRLAEGANNDLAPYQIFISTAEQVTGQNTITFQQGIKLTYKWGVTNLLLQEGIAPPPPPPPPPPAPDADINLVLNALETDPFGNRFLDQTDTDGIITASFESTGTDLTLSFMGYDVDNDREIRVFVNGVERDRLAEGVNNDLAPYQIFISAAEQVAGQNTVTFQQGIKLTYKWGVTNLMLEEDALATPTIQLNPASDTGLSSTDLITAETELVLSGTASPNTLVTVFANGTAQGSVASDASGNWALTTPAFADGLVSLTATSTNASGTSSPPSAPLLVEIDTVAPSTPVLTGFSDDTGVLGDGITTDTTLSLQGTAESEVQITVFDGATVLGTTEPTPSVPSVPPTAPNPPGVLAPKPVQNSILTLQIEEVGSLNNTDNSNNFASPVLIDGVLHLVDQRGVLWRSTDTGFEELLDVNTTPPAGITPDTNERIINIADGPGNTVYVAVTSTTLPAADIPVSALPDGTGVVGEETLYDTSSGVEYYQVIYKYQIDPVSGELEDNPQPLAAFETIPSGHNGGGMLVLPDGDLLFATGDNLRFNRDGRFAPQDPDEHISKLLIIDQDDGSFTVAAQGVRNAQRLTYTDDTEQVVAFADIGGSTAEEINLISVADILDTSTIENFGWGRIADDDSDGDGVFGTAREGLFYVNQGASGSETPKAEAIGEAPIGEIGFVQPYAQFGRMPVGEGFIAVSGPVFSNAFDEISALFSDLNGGGLYATTGPLSGVDNDVFAVNLVNTAGEAVSLFDLAGWTRTDPRLFNFSDGTAGVFLERTGTLYQLTEIEPDPVGAWTFETPELALGAHSFTAIATDLAGNVSGQSLALSVTIDPLAPEDTVNSDDFVFV